jgi:hypothetical protein
LKAVVRDGQWFLTTKYVDNVTISNGRVTNGLIKGMEYDLLKVVVKKMNMTIFLVPTPKGFEFERSKDIGNLVAGMFEKEIYIALGGVITQILKMSYFDTTNTYYVIGVRWYVPCSVKYPRWSSIFRILSMELWLVLIISIVFAAISTTFVARYSCTSEWQRYKTVTNSLTNVWAVILGVTVSTMPRAPSLRSLFLAWVCFSIAFSTVFQAFLTMFLIDSGYKTPIQNKEELLDSGIKLAYQKQHEFIFEKGDETEASKVRSNHLNCPLFEVCMEWAKYQKNVSVLLVDTDAEINYANGIFISENSEPLICKLEDGVVFNTGLTMIMLYGDPLMKRVSEIIDALIEAGIYNFWVSYSLNMNKIVSRKQSIVHPLDRYFSFNLYNMQPAFYLLLFGSFLSAICFIVELLYNHVLRKIKPN